MSKIWDVLRDEFRGLQLGLLAARLALAWLPSNTGGRLRGLALRLAGFGVGRGCLFMSMPRFSGSGKIGGRLSTGQSCFFNQNCYFDLAERITVGDGVTFGPDVMVFTGAHQLGPGDRRAGAVVPAAVTIGAGAWLGARCVVLPGVTIGCGAVIGAGAVVTRDVPENAVAAGVPARVLRILSVIEERVG